jgi:hypothetical protein
MNSSILSKLQSPNGAWAKDDESGLHVFDAFNQHVLFQASGYLKHVLSKDRTCGVFFRGQSKLYKTLEPSLYRGASTQQQKSNRDKALKAYISDCEGKVLSAVPEYAREPLLQHYGIRTSWLDLVDNIWVALWFACHTAYGTGPLGQYLHFERRKPSPDPTKMDYAYVLMVETGMEITDKAKPGLFKGQHTDLIDLRIAAPSTFIRPHAQHGLLFKRTKFTDHKHMDNGEFVAGVLRVRLRDALEWLGEGALLSTHALFPPATYDFGYRELLNKAPGGNKTIGSIHLVGA